ncbi:MAG TPA: GNAT family N-acetyltransferase [Streptosporangiaceae bacterium]
MTKLGQRQLRDGRTVVLRLAVPGDVAAIARLYMELSPESFRSRFQSGRAAPALADRLARFDGPSGTVCIVAAADDRTGRLAAEARSVPMGSDVAELGVTVLDEYQGSGLGHLLLAALVAQSSQTGLQRLRAIVSLSNTPMLRLLEPYGWALAAPTDLAVASLEMSAVGGMPGWPRDVTGRRVLVEQRGMFESERTASMRQNGDDVRQCLGPRRGTGHACPLLESGRCRLAEEADLIVALLPSDDEDCARVLQAHRQRWPERLAS